MTAGQVCREGKFDVADKSLGAQVLPQLLLTRVFTSFLLTIASAATILILQLGMELRITCAIPLILDKDASLTPSMA